MILRDEAAFWIGAYVVITWHVTTIAGRPKRPTESGGRVVRVDVTYLYLQPFALSAKAPASKPGEPVTRLGLNAVEERIPLLDIDTIDAAPLEGIQIDE